MFHIPNYAHIYDLKKKKERKRNVITQLRKKNKENIISCIEMN